MNEENNNIIIIIYFYVHNTLAFRVVLYRNQIWGLRKKKIKTIDIHLDEIFQKNSRVHLFDYKRNEGIMEEFKVEPFDKLKIFKSNWLRHVTRINSKMSKLMLNY